MKIDRNKLYLLLQEPQATFRTKLYTVGNSLNVRVPSSDVKEHGAKNGDKVQVCVWFLDEETEVVYEQLKRRLEEFPVAETIGFWSYVQKDLYKRLSKAEQQYSKLAFEKIKKKLEKSSSSKA